MATGGDAAVSPSVKYRPRTSGMCIASKYPAVTSVLFGEISDSPGCIW